MENFRQKWKHGMTTMCMCTLINLMCKTKKTKSEILYINRLVKYKNHKSDIKYKKIKDFHSTRRQSLSYQATA